MKKTIYSLTLLLTVQPMTSLGMGMLVPQNEDALVRSAQIALLTHRPKDFAKLPFEQFNEDQINLLKNFRTEAENRINEYEQNMAPVHFRSNILYSAAGITPLLLWNKTHLWSLPQTAAKILREQDVPQFSFSNFIFNTISLFSIGYLFYNAIPMMNQFLNKYHHNNARKNFKEFDYQIFLRRLKTANVRFD